MLTALAADVVEPIPQVPTDQLDLEKDLGYLCWRYKKMLERHQEEGGLAEELDKINAQILGLKKTRQA